MRSRPARKLGGSFVLSPSSSAGCGTVKSPTEPSAEPGGGTGLHLRADPGGDLHAHLRQGGVPRRRLGLRGMVLAAGESYGQIVDRRRPRTRSPRPHRARRPRAQLLVKKLRGDPDITGAPMPLDQPGGLHPGQIDGLIAWVRAGAPRDSRPLTPWPPLPSPPSRRERGNVSGSIVTRSSLVSCLGSPSPGRGEGMGEGARG